MNLKEAMAELEAMGDEGRRKHNAKTGPDGIPGAPPEKQFGCKTGDIRALAKRIKADHDLAMQLWKTGNLDAQLLAILLMKPKQISAEDIDRMVACSPQLDPVLMRVQTARLGKETLDGTTQTAQSGTDHRQAA